jgi:hypothetical protein
MITASSQANILVVDDLITADNRPLMVVVPSRKSPEK